MATRITVARDKVAELRARCTVKVAKRQGCAYAFIDDMVKHMKTNGDDAVVCARYPVEINQKPAYIVPFWVARELAGRLRPLEQTTEYKDNIVLRPFQQTDMEVIMEKLSVYGCALLLARPGYGKTMLFVKLISLMREPAIIVVPNRTMLAAQPYQVLCKHIENPERISILGNDGVIPENCVILVAMVNRLTKVKPEKLEKFTLVVGDEVHMLQSAANTAGWMNTRPRRMLCCTATLGSRHEITDLFIGNHIVKGSNTKPWRLCFPRVNTELDFAALKKKVSEKLSETFSKSRARRSDDGFDDRAVDAQRKLFEYTYAISALTTSKRLIYSVIKMAQHFVQQKERVMILTQRKSMTHALYERLKNVAGTDFVVEYLDAKKDVCHNCDVIVGTQKKMGTGFDEANSIVDFNGETVKKLICIVSIHDYTLFCQMAGRPRSENPLVIFMHYADFIKNGISFSDNHIEQLRKIVHEEIKECTIVDQEGRALENLIANVEIPDETENIENAPDSDEETQETEEAEEVEE